MEAKHTPNSERIFACVKALEGWADPSAATDLIEAAEAVFECIESGNSDISTPLELLEDAVAKARGAVKRSMGLLDD